MVDPPVIPSYKLKRRKSSCRSLLEPCRFDSRNSFKIGIELGYCFLSPGFTTLAKDAEVSEYVNFKEECLEIRTHLYDDKMALRG